MGQSGSCEAILANGTSNAAVNATGGDAFPHFLFWSIEEIQVSDVSLHVRPNLFISFLCAFPDVDMANLPLCAGSCIHFFWNRFDL